MCESDGVLFASNGTPTIIDFDLDVEDAIGVHPPLQLFRGRGAGAQVAIDVEFVDGPWPAPLTFERDFEREMLAEDEGALAQLSQHPRFGRHDDEFRTRGQKGEEQ